MGDLYASAVGTTVLQLKEIPPCPDAFDATMYSEYNTRRYDDRGWSASYSGDPQPARLAPPEPGPGWH